MEATFYMVLIGRDSEMFLCESIQTARLCAERKALKFNPNELVYLYEMNEDGKTLKMVGFMTVNSGRWIHC